MRAAQLLYSASHNRSGHAGMIGFKTPCGFGGRRGQLKERGISLVLRDASDQIGQADLVTLLRMREIEQPLPALILRRARRARLEGRWFAQTCDVSTM